MDVSALTGWIPAAAGIVLAASLAAWLLSLLSCRSFLRRAQPRDPDSPEVPSQPLSLLVPLKELDPGLPERLAAFAALSGARLEVLFGAAEDDGPVLEAARRAARGHEHVRVLEVPADGAVNPKVRTLLHLTRHARAEILMAADADVRLGPGAPARMALELQEPGVGLVTALYRVRPDERWVSRASALAVHTQFWPMAQLGRLLDGEAYAFGAVMLLGRDTLDAAGGWDAVADFLADDHELGRAVRRAGRAIRWSRDVCTVDAREGSVRAWFSRQLRWSRTYRLCRPLGYAFSGLTHTTTWALIALAVGGPALLALGAAALAARLAGSWVLCRRWLRAPFGWREVLLLFPLDLAQTVFWAGAFAGRHVRWAGVRYRVDAEGRLRPAERRGPLPAPPRSPAPPPASPNADGPA